MAPNEKETKKTGEENKSSITITKKKGRPSKIEGTSRNAKKKQKIDTLTNKEPNKLKEIEEIVKRLEEKNVEMKTEINELKRKNEELEEDKNSKKQCRGIERNSFSNFSFIARNLEKFSGEKKDNFEGWFRNAKLWLNDPNYKLEENEKTRILLIKLDGVAREIIQENMSYETILETLYKAYGRDKSTVITNCKQLPDEPVNVFLGRLKTNFSLLGVDISNPLTEAFATEIFISNLMPAIGEKVKQLYPKTYNRQ